MTDQISNERLLPCPFCGDKAFASATLDDGHYAMCRAEDCWAMTGYLPTKAEAIAAWNRRQSPAGVAPVAWRIGHQFDGDRTVWTYFDGSDEVATDKAQPLYASPPKAVTITDEHVLAGSFAADVAREAATTLRSQAEQIALIRFQQEIERLTQEIDVWKRHAAECQASSVEDSDKLDAAEQQVQKLTAENERLREALAFYRDRWAYTPNKRYGGLEWRPSEALLDDCGNIARSALETQEGRK